MSIFMVGLCVGVASTVGAITATAVLLARLYDRLDGEYLDYARHALPHNEAARRSGRQWSAR